VSQIHGADLDEEKERESEYCQHKKWIALHVYSRRVRYRF
jgi:hypothetical protein